MNPQEQAEFRQSIAREIRDWTPHARRREDPWWDAIERIPEYFDALLRLSRDADLGKNERRIVRRVIRYLVSPLDLMPELIYGPAGYREDLALIAMAADRLGLAVGEETPRRCGLPPDAELLNRVRTLAREDLDEDVIRHLEVLLESDAVAGDEDLAHEDLEPADLTASGFARAPEPGNHVMVFAGPGTGKTHRIETELQRLLVEARIPAEAILVTTFTNRAADELRVRIRKRLFESRAFADPDSVLQRLSISTIHAFCYSLIAEFHHHILFLKGTFSPMNETFRMLFLFRHGIGSLQLQKIYPEWKEEQRRAEGWRATDLFHFYSHVGQVYDFLSEEVLSGFEKKLRRRYIEIINGEGDGTIDERIIQTYPRYWRLVQAEGYLDHSMILAYTEALLDDPQIRGRVQARFQHLLVDEYQDTNPIQDRIFRAIAGSNGRLFAVGDDDQSIYAFRGADVRNATLFRENWPGAKTEALDENRRSTRAIVEATQALIRNNRVREPKELSTQNAEGALPWRIHADWDDLPERLGGLLLRLKADGVFGRWDEVALLFRGLTERVAAYREALTNQEIPSCVVGDRRFLRRPIVSGLLGVLEMIHGDAAKITRRKRVHRPFFQALGWNDPDSMLEAIRSWHRAFREARYTTMLDLFYVILNETNAIATPAMLPDLGHFSRFLAEAETQIRSQDLEKRLGWFLRYAKAASGSFDGPAPPPREAVQIMTIHKSKGLEFPVVVVADAVEEVIPAGFPEAVRTRLRRHLAGIEPSLDPLEEERRVLYVAMTRAERLIVLLTTPDKHSCFLREFPSIDAPKQGEGAPRPEGRSYARRDRHDPPLHLTHGEVYNFLFCRRRYLLENNHGFAGRAIAPFRAGQSLHRALEIFHRLVRDHASIPHDRVERIFEQSWIQPSQTGRGSREKARKEFHDLLEVFRRYVRSWKEGPDDLRVVDVERPFYVAHGEGVLTGKIDLVRERRDRLEIIEIKFNRNPMAPDYPRRQLDHYSLAYRDEQPDLLVHYLKEGHEETFPRSDPELIRAELSSAFSEIRKGRFSATPDPAKCGICPVRFACSDRADPARAQEARAVMRRHAPGVA